jgi:hypothetical protein
MNNILNNIMRNNYGKDQTLSITRWSTSKDARPSFAMRLFIPNVLP